MSYTFLSACKKIILPGEFNNMNIFKCPLFSQVDNTEEFLVADSGQWLWSGSQRLDGVHSSTRRAQDGDQLQYQCGPWPEDEETFQGHYHHSTH